MQGVGFRPFVYRLARELLLSGHVKNSPEGVEIEAIGPREAVDSLVAKLKEDAPPLARVREVFREELSFEGGAGAEAEPFRILESRVCGEAATEISPDIAPCEECIAELLNPADRRHRYPFINCTNCGPRYTIIDELPYDRPKTTMRSFTMCGSCSAEYRDPEDRRFHAQPDACGECGPSLQFISLPDRAPGPKGDEALLAALAALDRGAIVAIKGVGGFHLACDAKNNEAVKKLRERKLRDEKPFAVMVGDPEAARGLCHISSEEERLLASPQRPIVLLRKREGTVISEAIAPGNKNLGVMLPSTPLHHLLFEHHDSLFTIHDSRILVMTSGNVTDEPIAFENDEALERLSKIADAALVHDRPIRARVDDSVARVVLGAPAVIRRARGYVPEPVRLAFSLPRIFAAGADMKGAICLTKGKNAWLSEHLGDLGNALAHRAFEDAANRLGSLLDIEPEIVACDMHPDYFSTRFVRSRFTIHDSRITAVQHHHAHVASCMAENDLPNEKVIGIALDGTGYGPDGTVWGGEILVADYAGFDRVARFRPVAMPGGEAAAREPWRTALAWLAKRDDGTTGRRGIETTPSLSGIGEERLHVVRQMIEKGVNCPMTSSCGRLFDAVAALTGICLKNSFEGQSAMMLEQAADEVEEGSYSFGIRDSELRIRREGVDPLFEIDFAPTIAAVAEETAGGTPPPSVSARFHNALVDALAAACLRISGDSRFTISDSRVCLSGGCFQNAILSSKLKKRLEEEGLKVYTHSLVPAGDGGVALGQAVVAAHNFRDP